MSGSAEEQERAKSRGRPEGLPKLVERAAEGRGGVAAAAGRGHRRGEPAGSGYAAGTGAMASEVPGTQPAGPEGEERDLRSELMRTRAKLGELTMRVELQAELFEERGYGDELRRLLKRLDG